MSPTTLLGGGGDIIRPACLSHQHRHTPNLLQRARQSRFVSDQLHSVALTQLISLTGSTLNASSFGHMADPVSSTKLASDGAHVQTLDLTAANLRSTRTCGAFNHYARDNAVGERSGRLDLHIQVRVPFACSCFRESG